MTVTLFIVLYAVAIYSVDTGVVSSSSHIIITSDEQYHIVRPMDILRYIYIFFFVVRFCSIVLCRVEAAI